MAQQQSPSPNISSLTEGRQTTTSTLTPNTGSSGHLPTNSTNKKGKAAHICQYCQRQFSRKGRLRIHLRCHTGEKPYVCPYPNCRKAFSEKGNLKTHLRVHTGERPYKCTFEGCSSSFTTRGHLKDHLRKHLNERPFVCPECNKGFLRSSTLKVHIRTHTGEKPYVCDYPGCGKAFGESGNLSAHKKIHERDDTNKEHVAKKKYAETRKSIKKFVRKGRIDAKRMAEKVREEPVCVKCEDEKLPVPPTTVPTNPNSAFAPYQMPKLPDGFEVPSSPLVLNENKTPVSIFHEPSNIYKLPLSDLEGLSTPRNGGPQAWSPFAFRKLSSPINYPLITFHPYLGAMHSPAQSPAQGFMFGRSPTMGIPGYVDFSAAFEGNSQNQNQGAVPGASPKNFLKLDPKK